MCCSESEDSIGLNSENSFQLQPVFFSFYHSHFSSRSDVLHTVINCVQVQTLPTAQATPALTDSCSRSYDPHTHAWKARPLTTVGWTSLSVIVIVIVRHRPQTTSLHAVHIHHCFNNLGQRFTSCPSWECAVERVGRRVYGPYAATLPRMPPLDFVGGSQSLLANGVIL